ncbi:hypothetical protein PT273_03830 [Orbaceae bacterium ESL0727]|nr:hypothetical protein [Orbaceae bacterium ESL0727]
MKAILISITALLLMGCNALNYRTAPVVWKDCQYETLPGTVFQLQPLPANQPNYPHIYIAQSRESAHLPASYAGLQGKLTGKTVVRNYPKETFWHTMSLFDRASLYDDGYDDLYITPAQRESRDRKAKFVFRQAVLQNCQIVYIAVDSLAKDSNNPKLIEAANVAIIKLANEKPNLKAN